MHNHGSELVCVCVCVYARVRARMLSAFAILIFTLVEHP